MQDRQSDDNKKEQVVLTVFFGHTAHKVTETEPEIKADKVAEISGFNKMFQSIEDKEYAIAFNGAYTRNRLTGLIAGVGIEGQVRQVEKIVDDLVRQGKKVTVNCYGESRGGVAAFLTAKKLSRYSEKKVTTNLAVYDPVPGNTLMGRFLDFFNLTLTNQTLDLSGCHNLKNVLGIYNTGIMPFQTAILPIYPTGCKVKNEVVVSEHIQHSLWNGTHYKLKPIFKKMTDFLSKHGTRLKDGAIEYLTQNNALMKDETRWNSIRLHSILDKEILLEKEFPNDSKNDRGKIEQNSSAFETIILPFLLTSLKWLMLGAAIATLCYFTGGLAALPILGKLGALAIPAVLPVTTLIGRALSPVFNVIAQGISRVGYYLFQQDDPGIRNSALKNSNLGTAKSFLEKIQPYVIFGLRALAFGVAVAGVLYLTGGLAAIPIIGGLAAKGGAIMAAGSMIGAISGAVYAFTTKLFEWCNPSDKSLQDPPSISPTENSNSVITSGLGINPIDPGTTKSLASLNEPDSPTSSQSKSFGAGSKAIVSRSPLYYDEADYLDDANLGSSAGSTSDLLRPSSSLP